jgi:stage V sporulation protein G
LIQQKVIEAFERELEESKLPGYVSRYDDFDHEDSLTESDEPPPKKASPRREPARGRVEPPAAPAPVQQSRVQPPQRPSGPHKSPVHQTTPPAKGEFGAGIF